MNDKEEEEEKGRKEKKEEEEGKKEGRKLGLTPSQHQQPKSQ